MRRPPALIFALAAACSSASTTTPPPGNGEADAGSDAGAVMGNPDSGAPPDAGVAPGDGGLPLGAAPTRRGDMFFARDPASGRVFMFDGDKAEPIMCSTPPNDIIDDGYVFDPATNRWAELAIEGPQPLKRTRAAATWDTKRGRLVVFGGRHREGTVGAYEYLNDVWAYDPATNAWTELAADTDDFTAPRGRMNTALVYDAPRDRLLIHGGGQTSGTAFAVDSQTWAFDLEMNRWSRIARNGTQPFPPNENGRLFHMAALDAQRGRLFIYGGGGAGAFQVFVEDMWYLDIATETWTQVDLRAGGPLARIKGVMEYDAARDRLILFAGHDLGDLGNDNELWTFDLATLRWTRQIEGDVYNAPGMNCDFPADFAIVDPDSPERRESHVFSVAGDTAIMFGGRTDCGLANDTWSLDLRTLRWTRINDSFSGMTCHRSGRTDCDQPGAKKCG